jgi:alpha-tubulin suppressor-like RCC1 family protein
MGDGHALALRSDGTVWAWGGNYAGQCGIVVNDTSRVVYTPVQVSGLDDVKSIAAGRGFSLALKDDGTVWAWGDNSYGTLGDSRKSNKHPDNTYPEPSMIPGLTRIIAIDANEDYAMALKDDGTVWAWGNNGFSQLGNANKPGINIDDFVSDLHVVTALSDVKAIACGPVNAIAIKKDGSVWLWGRRDYILGERFLSIFTSGTSIPGILDDVGDVISAAAGETHAIILKNDGTLWAWGDNWRGKLGNGSKNYHSLSGELTMIPIQVPGLYNVVAIDAGIEHSVALLADGSVVAWGGNEMGQIGDGTKEDRNSPVLLPLANTVKISAAGLDTMVLDASGNIWMSGDNTWGQVGNNSYTDHQIIRYPAYVMSPVMVDFSAIFGPPVVPGKGDDNVSTPTPVPDDNTQSTATPNAGNNSEGTPIPLQEDGGNINTLLLATAGIAVLIIAFFVYWAIKK